MPISDFRRHRKPGPARGVTLVDLLVGLVIGLLIALAALSALSTVQLGARTLHASVELQQQADDALQNIGKQIRQAGAIVLRDSSAGNGQVVISGDFSGYASPELGGAVVAIHGSEGNSANGDTLRLSNEDNQSRRDCLGDIPLQSTGGATARGRVDSAYLVHGNVLRCRGSKNPVPQPLADGVEDFQVRYGIRTETAAGPWFQYLSASEISDWSQVHTVRVCLQLAGASLGHPIPDPPRTGCNGSPLSADGRLRNSFSRVFSIRNALP